MSCFASGVTRDQPIVCKAQWIRSDKGRATTGRLPAFSRGCFSRGKTLLTRTCGCAWCPVEAGPPALVSLIRQACGNRRLKFAAPSLHVARTKCPSRNPRPIPQCGSEYQYHWCSTAQQQHCALRANRACEQPRPSRASPFCCKRWRADSCPAGGRLVRLG